VATEREQWTWRGAFVFAVIGSAVGLGNIWRFPYIAYSSGGGAFLIPYFIALLTAGVPLMMLEFAIGHKFRGGAPKAMAGIGKGAEWVGWWATAAGFVIISYYAVVMAWAIRYIASAATLAWGSDAAGYFFNQVLHISDSPWTLGGIPGPVFIGFVIGWVMMFLIVYSGVKGVGKVVMVTMPLPVILLIVLAIRGLTLPGAIEGINYYLNPDFSKLADGQVWLAAYSQIFFSLSVAMAILIAYASYLPKDAEIANNAYLSSFANCSISFLAGFAIFSTLGYMAYQQGVPVSEVAAAGVGLAFVGYPTAISLMPVGPAVFGVLFFLLLVSAAIDSAFSLTEGIVTSVKDKWNMSRAAAVAIVTGVAFVVGLLFTTSGGLYWLDIVDHFVNNFGLVLVGLAQCIVVGWIFGADKLRNYINERSEIKVGAWYDFCVKWLTPAVLLVILGWSIYQEIVTPYGGYEAKALIYGGWLMAIALPIIAYVFSRFRGGGVEA